MFVFSIHACLHILGLEYIIHNLEKFTSFCVIFSRDAQNCNYFLCRIKQLSHRPSSEFLLDTHFRNLVIKVFFSGRCKFILKFV